MKSGIVGWNFALPAGRVAISTLAATMGQDADLFAGLGLKTRTIAGSDENTFTLCLRAGKRLLMQSAVDLSALEYCLLGSETPLHGVNPTSSMLGAFLQVPETAQMFDLEFACKAGTAALQMVAQAIEHKPGALGLVCAGDVGSGTPGDALAYTAGAAGVALLVGNSNTHDVVATIEHMTTLNKHRLDFWRGATAAHPQHAGRWSGATYKEIITESTQALLTQAGKAITEFDHVVLHMPNGKLPLRAAQQLGITRAQLAAGWVVETIGNTYSACVPLGLCSVLSQAQPGQDILVVSYGSGAGSDAFWLRTTDAITQGPRPSVLAVAEALPLLDLERLLRMKKK